MKIQSVDITDDTKMLCFPGLNEEELRLLRKLFEERLNRPDVIFTNFDVEDVKSVDLPGLHRLKALIEQVDPST